MIAAPNTDNNRALIDLTPLIDIVFIIIVFLLLCMNSAFLELPFTLPQDANPELPQANKAQTLAVHIHSEQPYFELEKKRYDRETLEAVLAEKIEATTAKEKPIAQIASSATAPVEPLLQLLSLLNKYHLENTQILMENN